MTPATDTELLLMAKHDPNPVVRIMAWELIMWRETHPETDYRDGSAFMAHGIRTSHHQ